MPLRTSRESDAERRAIEQEWETERAYPIANLSTTRRGGLSFVKASKTDEQWTAESRAGILVQPTDDIERAKREDQARQHAKWYSDLVRSGSSTPVRASVDGGQIQPVASTSRVTLDKPSSKGKSKETPIVLDMDQEDDNGEGEDIMERHVDCHDVSQNQSIQQPEAAVAAAVNPEVPGQPLLPPDPLPPDADLQEAEDNGDMFCVLCKTVIPAQDVPRHTTSVLHQLSKDPARPVSQPLVPPTYYGVRSTNVGYAMMKRLGWTEEQGLGTDQSGRKVPIRAVEKFDRKGVGVDSRKRQRELEEDGKVHKARKAQQVKVAKPLAKNRKEMDKARKREMEHFKAGLAYLNN